MWNTSRVCILNPCAETLLISASFQCQYVCRRSKHRCLFFLMTLPILRSSGQVFRTRKFVWCFSHDYIGRKTTQVKCHFNHIIPRVCTTNMICDCWRWPWSAGWVVFVRFLYSSVLPSPLFPHFSLWKLLRIAQNICLTALKLEYLHKLFFWVRNFPFLPHLFVQLFLSHYRLPIFILYFGHNPM